MLGNNHQWLVLLFLVCTCGQPTLGETKASTCTVVGTECSIPDEACCSELSSGCHQPLSSWQGCTSITASTACNLSCPWLWMLPNLSSVVLSQAKASDVVPFIPAESGISALSIGEHSLYPMSSPVVSQMVLPPLENLQSIAISDDCFQHLDVQHLPSLKELHVRDVACLKTAALSFLPALTSLAISSCNLTSFDLPAVGSTKLQHLQLDDNPLQHVTLPSQDSELYWSLESLDLSSTHLTTFNS